MKDCCCCVAFDRPGMKVHTFGCLRAVGCDHPNVWMPGLTKATQQQKSFILQCLTDVEHLPSEISQTELHEASIHKSAKNHAGNNIFAAGYDCLLVP